MPAGSAIPWAAWWNDLFVHQIEGVPTVQASDLGTCQHIGFLPLRKKSTVKENIAKFEISEYLQNFDPLQRRFNTRNLKHTLVVPDFQCQINQVRLIGSQNNCPDPDVPHDVLVHAENLMHEMFDNFGVHSLVRPLFDVDYNPNGAVGYGLHRIFKNKKDIVDKGFLETEYPQYRKRAHREGWPQLWTMADKREILPKEKAKEKNTRVYEFSQGLHFFSTAQDNQAFNKKMYTMTKFQAVGSIFQRGGFNRMIKRLMRIKGISLTGDVRKWDKRFGVWLLWFCHKFRVHRYRGTDKEYSARMYYQYINEIFCYILLTNGQVIQAWGTQLSGRVNTTSDNTLAHMYILFCFIVFHCGKISLKEVYDIMEALIYADDHIMNIRWDHEFLTPFDTRREFYTRFLMDLKKEDDRIQDHPYGLVFLGAKIKDYHGYFVPSYDADRLKAGLIIPKSKLTIEQEYAKVFALFALSVFCEDEEFIYNIHDYLIFLHCKTHGNMELNPEEFDEDLIGVLDRTYIVSLTKVPTINEMRDYFWLGLESSFDKVRPAVVQPAQRTQVRQQVPLELYEYRPSSRELLWKWVECWQTSKLNC